MITEMDPKTRFLMALNHEEPDRVPLFELGIDSLPVLEKYAGKSIGDLMGLLRWMRYIIGWKRIFKWLANRSISMKYVAKSVINLYKAIGYDACVIPVALLFTKGGFLNIKQYVDEYGRRFKYSHVESGGKMVNIAFYDGGYFDTDDPEAAYDEFYKDPLDPDHRARSAVYKAAVEIAKDDIYTFPGIVGFLEGSWESFGFPTYTRLLYSKPTFIERVIRDRGDFSVALAENMLNLGAETILMFDDAGHKNGPFLSPKMYEKLIIPQIKRVCDKVHSYDGKVILHSCGNINKLLKLIVNAGVDGLNPLEAGSGMDIFQVKRDYGKNLCLIGNIDPIGLLTHGTPEKIDTYIKQLIKEVAPGGGFCLASGHSVTYSVPLENFEAMLAAGRKYGSYPIQLD
jgi:uroporphyrinogen-III decarboxylase